MKLYKTKYFQKIEKKFFNKHQNLLQKYGIVLKKLQENPFEGSLKTHKLKGDLAEYYACSLNYEFRIILTIKIADDEVYLINIGSHDEVY